MADPNRARDHGGGFVPSGSQAGRPPIPRNPTVYATARPHGGTYVQPGQYRNGSASSTNGGGFVQGQYPTEVNPQGNLSRPQGDIRYAPTDHGYLPGVGQSQAGSHINENKPQAYVNAEQYTPGPDQQNIPSGNTGIPNTARDVAVAILQAAEPQGIADTMPEFNQHRRTYQEGTSNIFKEYSSLRWKYPNSFQMPQLRFRATDRRRHRDIMQRVYEGVEDDRYISPFDGHVAKLVVQATQEVYDGARNATWRRTFVRNISPPYIHLGNWPFVSVPVKVEHWTEHDWVVVCAKWLPTCGALLFVLMFNANGNAQVRNGGYYDAFNYKHWGYPKTARNVLENPPTAPMQQGDLATTRILGPRYLCFLTNPQEQGDNSVTIVRMDDSTANTDYIFIGYSTQQFNNNSNADMEDLHQMAARAAREAGVHAFWVAGSCMPDIGEREQDVYRISDVMRSARSLVIIVGPLRSSHVPQTRDELLRDWGTRMWTLPEALLNPSASVKVYTRGYEGEAWEVAKKHFAAVVWSDPLISRQLVDHYNKSLDLSRLELVTIALKCLSRRSRGEYLPGDLSYALMGLMRQRPTIDSSDTEFQAFARLSMANDGDRILERLICMLPINHYIARSWLNMDDAWDCNLWDIYPSCQVAGVGPGDTVILDGAFGAAIRWKSFARVAILKRASWKRLGALLILHGAPLYFFVGIVLLSFPGSYKAIGAIFLVFSLIVVLASPYLTRVVYNGKLWGTQAWFQGFEGYMDLATIESHIFGAYMGRLKWSTAGSPLSSHHMNRFGECVGVDPMSRPEVRAMLENAKTGGYGTLKVFTLVDTYTMTVTMFASVRPPVAVLLCGSEGGMQRAVMCSYDWATQTVYRETVLRMETPVLERMSRVNRFRFGLRRPDIEVQPF